MNPKSKRIVPNMLDKFTNGLNLKTYIMSYLNLFNFIAYYKDTHTQVYTVKDKLTLIIKFDNESTIDHNYILVHNDKLLIRTNKAKKLAECLKQYI